MKERRIKLKIKVPVYLLDSALISLYLFVRLNRTKGAIENAPYLNMTGTSRLCEYYQKCYW